MRGLAVALAAFLALAGLVAAAAAEQAGAGGLGGVFSWRRGRALSQTGESLALHPMDSSAMLTASLARALGARSCAFRRRCVLPPSLLPVTLCRC